jgi:hypothetical protein
LAVGGLGDRLRRDDVELVAAKREFARDQSWADLNEAKLPQSYDVVAKAQSSGDPLALFAWLKAAELHLRDLQSGYVGGPPEPQPDGSLTTPDRLNDESKKVAQDSADEYYSKVLESAKSQSDNPAMNAVRALGAVRQGSRRGEPRRTRQGAHVPAGRQDDRSDALSEVRRAGAVAPRFDRSACRCHRPSVEGKPADEGRGDAPTRRRRSTSC